MSHEQTARQAEDTNLRHALLDIATFAESVTWESTPIEVRERVETILTDTWGAMVAGSGTSEHQKLLQAWDLGRGPATVVGAPDGARSSTLDAAWLNAVAAVLLELDEGNKYAGGHPATHVFPALLSAAEVLHSTGDELASAFLVGYEIASRFGYATNLHPDVHPHGNWAIAGCAAAVAKLMGRDAVHIASAIDVATALPIAGSWEAVLRGSGARNAWVGSANAAGIAAARMAGCDLPLTLAAQDSLGGIVGDWDQSRITEDLGARYFITDGYIKRHSSCSATHPPVDAILAIIAQRGGFRTSEIKSVLIETHSLAASMDRRVLPTALAARFSVPYTAAVALLRGKCSPEDFESRQREDPDLRQLMSRIEVRASAALTSRLPAERSARVTIELVDGKALNHEVSNPVGDCDHHPFGRADVANKWTDILPGGTADRVLETAAALTCADDVAAVLRAHNS